jgi:hypothetical protein
MWASMPLTGVSVTVNLDGGRHIQSRGQFAKVDT